MNIRAAATLAASLGLGLLSLGSLRAETLSIVPGPATISAAEAALVADSSHGIDGAIILVDESDRNDVTDSFRSRFSRHVRAKILSDEGRSLAELRIPLGANGRVVSFWGRTIAPGGKVSELRREDLETSDRWRRAVREFRPNVAREITNSRRFDADFSVLHGTLPDVVPGSVIDFGWTVEAGSFATYARTPLQGTFAVRRLRHRWVPNQGLECGVRVPNDPMHRVHIERKAAAILIGADDLPAERGEPLGPRPPGYLASEVIYYLPAGRHVEDYWESIGAEIEKEAAAFVGDTREVQRIVASAGLGASEDLDAKLRNARSWLFATIPERRTPRSEPLPKTLAEAIRRHEAGGDQITSAFAAIARALGAEVEIVLARNRQDGPWHPEILSTSELNNILLRARRPGAPDGEAVWIDIEPDVPYGTAPPEAQGARGIAVSRAHARTIELPVASSSSNRAETTATVAPGAEGGGSARWVAKFLGGPALDLRRQLRLATAEERPTRVQGWCSLDADHPDASAEIRGGDDPESTFELHCGIGLGGARDTAPDGRRAISVEGPWLAKLPVLPPGPRRFPVILPFASRESAVIDVLAPDGHVAGDVPAGLRFSGRFGQYELTVEREGGGFRVSRTLTIGVIEVQPSEYAAFRDFLDDVREADRIALPFVRIP